MEEDYHWMIRCGLLGVPEAGRAFAGDMGIGLHQVDILILSIYPSNLFISTYLCECRVDPLPDIYACMYLYTYM